MRSRTTLKQAIMLLCLWSAMTMGWSPAHAIEACPPVELRGVEELLGQAQSKLQLVDYPAALSTLEDAERLLPCVAEFVPTQVLARLFIYRGLTWFYLSNNEEARQAFLRALAIDPDLRWDPKFGQRPKRAFDEAAAQHGERAHQPVRAPALVEGVTLLIDGREIAPSSQADLVPGTHFLQLRWSDGRWEGAFFEVTGGRDTTLPLPPRALLAAAPGPSNGKKPPRKGSNAGSPTPSTGTSSSATSSSRTPFLVSAGAAGVGLASGLSFTLITQSARSKLCGGGFQPFSCREPAPSTEENQALAERTKVNATIANVSLAAAVVATGSAIYFVRRLKADERSRSSSLLVPVVAPGSAALVFHHEF